MDAIGEGDKREVRRPMNAFLIFCKRHRSIVREKNPDLDNRSVTRILGDLWANLKEEEKVVYTDLAKQYKDAFMKANPDYRWHNPEKTLGCQKSTMPLTKPTNAKLMKNDLNILPEGSIMPGKLADPCNMGGLSLLLMAGEQSGPVPTLAPKTQEMPNLLSNKVKPDISNTREKLVPALDSSREPTVVSKEELMTTSNVASSEKKGIKFEPGNYTAGNEGNQIASGQIIHNSKDMLMYTNMKNRSPQDILPKLGEVDAGLKTTETTPQHKSLLYQAVAAPKIPQRSLLAEAFKEQSGFPDILRDNSASSKMANFENLSKIVESKMNNNTFEQKVKGKLAEKENLTGKNSKESKNDNDSKCEVEDESAMVTCGKVVVNHIIDKLYSTDFGTGVRRINNNTDEVDGGKDEDNKRMDGKQEYSESVKENETLSEVLANKTIAFDAVGQKNMQENMESEDKPTRLRANSAEYLEYIKTEEENDKTLKKPYRQRLLSESDKMDCDNEDFEEFQPVRKSRRRNRGQRYQELINEGIIQRSKERTAALQQTTLKDENLEEDSQPIETLNSYILPETAIRRIRKRTTSESAKDKLLLAEDAKRYKTGDFDLEAQIATLPACSVENMGRKRGFGRQRHSSECFHTNRKLSEHDVTHQSHQVFDVHKTVSLPPHIKLPLPESSTEPVIGSRKRKARKHSITHMIPAPPTLVNNGKLKADANSLGPCLIKPTEQTVLEKPDISVKTTDRAISKTEKSNEQSLNEKVDSSIKGSSDSTMPLNGKCRDNQTSENSSDWSQCDKSISNNGSDWSKSNKVVSTTGSDWSKCGEGITENDSDKSHDWLEREEDISQSKSVSEKIGSCEPKFESAEYVSENKHIETGSVSIFSGDCLTPLKTVTQSRTEMMEQPVGAIVIEIEKKDYQKENECEKNSSVAKCEITDNKPAGDFTTQSRIDVSGKAAKDVNSNTTMN